MDTPASLVVKRVALDALHPDPANARSHDNRNLDAIRASLARFGQREAILIQAGTNRVIGGHGRLHAMRTLGWTHCEVIEWQCNDLEATALGIALNRTAETAGWDTPALAALLESLRAENALDGVGYTSAEIDELLADLDTSPALPLDDPGPGEPPVNPVTRPGDLFILGEQVILCGDSTDPADIQRVLGGEKAALFSFDPPYAVDYTGNDRPIHDGKPSGKDWSHLYHETDIKDLGEFMDQVFTACLPHVEDFAAVYVWHAHVQQPTIAAVFERHGLLLHQILVWVKPTATFGHSFYRWRHEPCAFGWKRGHKPTHGYGSLETVWECDWEGKSRVVGNEHPCQKPLRLFEIPMEQHTKPGAIVLEPFSGSGTQILAAEKLGRRCRAVEISPAFVDVAVRRWQEATRKEARLETGGTFVEVAAERGVA